MSGKPTEISRTTLHRGRVLELQAITWRDAEGKERIWETTERAHGRGAVLVIARLAPSGRLVLIRQHRPPARGEVIEFPAGIVDAGEGPEEAALRELREETGYHGRIVRVRPPSYNTPGLSGETVQHVTVEIDEALPANAVPRPAYDDGEHIETELVAEERFGAFLTEELARGTQFDGKVLAYLEGWSAARGR